MGAMAVISLLGVSVHAALPILAQQWRQRSRFSFDPESNLGLPDNLEINPSFAFARVRFQSHRQRRRPGWSHDYPQAEQNLLQIVAEVTDIYTSPRAHAVVQLDSPDIMQFPVLYFSEPGTWAISPEEAENFRSYLLRGGFAIFDDFDGPWDWENFEQCMALVLPGRHFELLELEEPVFQSFFHIKTLDMVPPYGAHASPTFHGLKDDNGRVMAVANFNNDIGDYWEWSNHGFYPIELSNEGYKFGVNYIIYAMTH